MTISFVDVTAPAVAATDTLVVDKPAGVVEGDAMLMQVMIPGARPSCALPDGWLEVPLAYTGPSPRVLILWKLAGASEPDDYTLLFPATDTVAAGIVAFRSDTVAHMRVEAAASFYEDGSAASAFERYWPTVEVAASAAMLCFFGTFAANTGSTPVGATERWDTGSTRQYLMTAPFSGPGTTPAASATTIVQVDYRNVTVALIEDVPTPYPGPQYIAATSVLSNVDGSQSVTLPAVIVAGDMLVAHLTFSVAKTPTMPAGWAALDDATITGADGLHVYIKTATDDDAGDTLTATFAGGAVDCGLGVTVARSLRGRTLAIELSDSQSNSASATIAYPDVTTAYANALLLYLASFDADSNITAPFDAISRYRPGVSGLGINAITKLIFAAQAYASFTSVAVGTPASTTATIVIVELDPVRCPPTTRYVYDEVDISPYCHQADLTIAPPERRKGTLGDTGNKFVAGPPDNVVRLQGDWSPEVDALLGRDAFAKRWRTAYMELDDCTMVVRYTWAESVQVTEWRVTSPANSKQVFNAMLRHNGLGVRTVEAS